MARLDQTQVRRSNLGLVLRDLRANGGRSRARLATDTGLSKATTSSLIADLAARGLVREGDVVRDGAVGRPGQTVQLDGRAICGIGVEINVDYLALTGLDLQGTVVHERVEPLDVAHLPVAQALDRIAALVRDALRHLAAGGYVTVAVAVAAPGIIDLATGVIRFAPNIGWRDVPLAAGIAARLDPAAPPILVENDAKLGVVAEFAALAGQGVEDVLALTGDVGVGAGIIAGGRLVRGWSGFAGEVGHLPLDPGGTRCNCGRVGCWETVVGLAPFLRLAAAEGDTVHDPHLPLEDRMATLRGRADAGDPRVLEALDRIAVALAAGLGILVDVLNPRMIVLGGYFGSFGPYLVPPVDRLLAERRLDEGSVATVTVSTLGLMAAARGGAHTALDAVFEDPRIVPPSAGARTG